MTYVYPLKERSLSQKKTLSLHKLYKTGAKRVRKCQKSIMAKLYYTAKS